MDSDTVKILIELNRQFYQTFGESFSATRQRLQPGVRKIIERIPRNANVLDLGCGNGELWRTLKNSGWSGRYVGLDFSSELLKEVKTPISHPDNHPADQETPDSPAQSTQGTFLLGDLTSAHWDDTIPNAPFDFILAFSVLHHIPSQSLRHRIMGKARRLASPGCLFVHSEWQFLNSPRLRERIQSWSSIGLIESQVEINDYLLDWRRDGYGLRYVHHFSLTELEFLAQESGFQIIESFNSDGADNNLGLYQVWKLAEV